MTIHGVGYRPLVYEPTAARTRLWPIASLEFLTLFRTRWGVVVFSTCQIPAIAGLVLLLITAQVWQLGGPEGMGRMTAFDARTNPLSPLFYLDTVPQPPQFALFLVLTFLVSCRAIAKDRASNALEIYWTRGITPLGYFLGKWLGSFLLLGVGFVAVPIVLWVIGYLLIPDPDFFADTIGFMPRLVLARIVFTAVLSGVAVGFSALSRSPNLAAMLWVFLSVGSAAAGRFFTHAFADEEWLMAISPWHSANRVVDAIAGIEPRQAFDVGPPLIVLGVIAVALAIALRRRLSLEDAVA